MPLESFNIQSCIFLWLLKVVVWVYKTVGSRNWSWGAGKSLYSYRMVMEHKYGVGSHKQLATVFGWWLTCRLTVWNYEFKGFSKAYKIYSVFLSLVDSSLVDSEVDCLYFCGNSLGLQPKQSGPLVNQELDKWQQMYVTNYILLDI